MTEATLSVFRGDAKGGAEVEYRVPVEPGMVVLDAILWIQAHQAPDLAVRWNCKAAKCGSCSAEVNGKPALMCKSRMEHLAPGRPISVRPMKTFPVIRDLVTDVSWNYEINRRIRPFAPRPGADHSLPPVTVPAGAAGCAAGASNRLLSSAGISGSGVGATRMPSAARVTHMFTLPSAGSRFGKSRREWAPRLSLRSAALRELEALKDRAARVRVQRTRVFNPGWHLARDLRNMLLVSEAIAKSALLRTESRGAHSRLDHPNPDAALAKVNMCVRLTAGGMQVAPTPLPEMPAELKALFDAPLPAAEPAPVTGGKQ